MDKYPGISPYAYCAWNPVKLVDPNGMDTININIDKGTIERIKADGDHIIFYFRDGELSGADQIKGSECKFWSSSADYKYTEGNEEKRCSTYYLYCSDVNVGERIFNQIAALGSQVEWDYYSTAVGKVSSGELSSSGIRDKMIHSQGMYTAENVSFWDHYHPSLNSESFFPSHSDQDHARELKGARCTIFCDGLSLHFQRYVPSHENAYINVRKFKSLWHQFAK